jgi:hypothetical protein
MSRRRTSRVGAGSKAMTDGFDFPAELRMRQRHEEIGIAKVAIVFPNFILEYGVITEGVE